MDNKNLKINAGDELIHRSGSKGIIDSICNCDSCKKSGYHIPIIWWYRKQDIGGFQEGDEKSYYKIGNNYYPENLLNLDFYKEKIVYLYKELEAIKNEIITCEEIILAIKKADKK